MRIINIKDKDFELIHEPLCAAIGNFDGVHIGHQKLIEESKRHGLKSAILTFYPHPSIFLKNIKDYKLLTPMEHKADLFSRMGIDYLIIIEFNTEIANLDKDEFINWMKKLNIKACVCGHDFSFGAKALGTPFDLYRHFETYIINKYSVNNVRVSTSYIKELLDQGNVEYANKLLGRDFSIRGKVVYGSQEGRLIGFPTANIDYRNYYLPINGVYFVGVKLNNVLYYGMCNVGNNPTFNYSYTKRLEVHVFGLNEDIYGQNVEVFFFKNIRKEIKFKSKEELVEQLKKDKLECYLLSSNMNYTK